eukprot:1156410-Pelagomonas_calceolata.AAC.4
MVCLSTVCPGVRGVYLCVVRPGVMCPGVHGVCLSAACPGGRTDACRTAMAGAKESNVCIKIICGLIMGKRTPENGTACLPCSPCMPFSLHFQLT